MHLIQKPYNYTLTKTSSGHILSVVCGTVGLYEVDITLNEAQLSNYTTVGEAYIDELASQIRANPQAFSR